MIPLTSAYSIISIIGEFCQMLTEMCMYVCLQPELLKKEWNEALSLKRLSPQSLLNGPVANLASWVNHGHLKCLLYNSCFTHDVFAVLCGAEAERSLCFYIRCVCSVQLIHSFYISFFPREIQYTIYYLRNKLTWMTLIQKARKYLFYKKLFSCQDHRPFRS